MDAASRPTIAIGCDHAGPALKRAVVDALRAAGHSVLDLGTDSDASVDYPDFAHAVCGAVERGQAERGVLICGTGVGMAIAANRHAGIRCAVASEVTTAQMCRKHNDANVLAFGARLIDEAAALAILQVFLATPYEGGRHAPRLVKLAPLETRYTAPKEWA